MGDQLQHSVDVLRLSARHNPLNIFVEHTEQLLVDTDATIQTARAQINEEGGINLNDEIRIDLYRNLLPQLLSLPGLFDYPANNAPARALREKLISYDGVYGLVTEHLPVAVDLFDHLVKDSGQDDMIGSINELTALALYNRAQNTNALALPTLPRKDSTDKIDIQYYSYIHNQPAIADLQVKSNVLAEKRIFGVRTLTGNDLGNSQHNYFWQQSEDRRLKAVTARALIQEINGTASEQQSATLDRIEQHINSIAMQELRSDSIARASA
jgi:hypothetical protein